MKLFKKALLATAIFGAMGAQAASINNDKFKLSAEGIALEVPAVASDVYFDIKVDKEHASGSLITLTFDNNIDLSGVKVPADGKVEQDVGSGESNSGDVYFDYGTGSFTFNNVKLVQADKSKGIPASISFNVNLGNPLTANSAFRISFKSEKGDAAASPAVVAGDPIVKVLGASTLQYKSVAGNNDDTVIETGSTLISEEVSQFDFAVSNVLDGLIERNTLTKFVGVNDSKVDTDTLTYTFTNDESLGMALRDVEATIRFTGNFKGLEAAPAASANVNTADKLTVAVVGAAVTNDTFGIAQSTGAAPVTTSVYDEYVYGDSSTTFTPATAGAKETYTQTFTFANDGESTTKIPVTGDVVASVLLTKAASKNTGTALTTVGTGYALFSGVKAGNWAIDATIINIPYLPINAENTDTFIHFANETDKEVDVIVTAIDNRGFTHGPFNLGYKLPANTVSKFSEEAMDKFFNLDGVKTKLSVTFNVDADKGAVSAYAVSQNDKGRTEVSTSQQRGN